MTAALPALPYLAPWYRLVQLPGKVVLEHGQRIVALEGRAVVRLLPALLPLLDGTRTLDEIVRILGDAARPAVENVLIAARAALGVLVDGPPVEDDEPRPFAETGRAARRPYTRAAERVAGAVEALRGCSVAHRRAAVASGLEVARLLRSSGVDVRRIEGAGGGCRPDDLRSRPRRAAAPPDWNEQALEAALPWLQVLPVRRALCRRRAAVPPGRHLLLRVLPASARGQPRRGRGRRPARGRARVVSVGSPAVDALAARDRRPARARVARARRPLRAGGVLRARARADVALTPTTSTASPGALRAPGSPTSPRRWPGTRRSRLPRLCRA